MNILKPLEQIIINAKKTLSRPYTVETIDEKILEVQNIRRNIEGQLTDKTEEKNTILEKLIILEKEALDLLEQHREKKQSQIKNLIMANLDINELSIITKLILKFSGKPNELNDFITNLETVTLTIPEDKSASFFNFIFKSRIELRVQNRLKQTSVPTSITELIASLKATYKPLKTSNTILNEINRTTQRDGNILGFANKIENLITELNEIQISEEGESHRSSIISTNNKIAFNAFMNGLTDAQIITTIDASQVKTFNEAVKIAEQVTSRTTQKQIFHQKVSSGQGTHYRQQQKCRNCGGSHGSRCPAEGMKCHNCNKLNHYSRMCRSKPQQNNNNNTRHNSQQNNGTNNNNQRYNNPNQRNIGVNNRSRNANHIQEQGNSTPPEVTQMEPPQGIY